MKQTLIKSLTLFIKVVMVFIIGITPSFLISTVVVLTTNITMQECVTFVPFWIAVAFYAWYTSYLLFEENE